MYGANDTDVVIVGGGPGGVVAGYLLARAGVKVKLLEAYKDFNRQFRGDTLNPLALGLLDQMGLMEEIQQLPHNRVDQVKAVGAEGIEAYDLTYSRMPSKFPFVMIIAQPVFLDFMIRKAKAYPNFSVEMQARATDLLIEDAKVVGLRYKNKENKDQEIRARLVIGADGRNSVIRKAAGLQTITTTRTTDYVVWLRLPLEEGDPEEGLVAREVQDLTLFMFRRKDEWQVSLTLKKGVDHKEWKSRGIEQMRSDVTLMVPQFEQRMQAIDWKDTALLPVELKRAVEWARDGVLIIGDAAHVMSPFGGIGINLAIRDAVITANTLYKPLLDKAEMRASLLKKVQDRVHWELRMIQWIQAKIQDSAPAPDEVVGLPPVARFFLRIPVLRDLPVFLLSFGLVPVWVNRNLLRRNEYQNIYAVGD